jgi:ubiquinone/menaquinone biosynthesis C-methylase UbiE
MLAADLGCGTGFLTFEAAKKVGIDGIVYAVDIQPGIISVIESGKKLYGLSNIETIQANLEIPGSTKLEDDSIDYVFVATILYQVNEKNKIIDEAKRIVKPDGHILIFDWRKQNVSFGPTFNKRFGLQNAKELGVKTKLKYVKEIDAGDFHYGLLYQK